MSMNLSTFPEAGWHVAERPKSPGESAGRIPRGIEDLVMTQIAH